jgi:hypothetical protein
MSDRKIKASAAVMVSVIIMVFLASAVNAVTYIQKSTGGQILLNTGGVYNDSGVSNFFSGCSAGNSIRSINPNGSVTCEYDDSGGGMSSWYLAASGTGGSEQVTDTETVTISGGTGISATRSGSTVTVTNTGVTSESDPEVGTYWNANYGCYSSGSQVTCADSAFILDATNHRLGIGKSPSTEVDVSGVIRASYFSCSDCLGKTQIDESSIQDRITGSCSGTQVINSILSDGTVSCASYLTAEIDSQVASVDSDRGCYGTGSAATCANTENFYWNNAANEMRLGSNTDQGSYTLQVTGNTYATGFDCSGCIDASDLEGTYCGTICTENEVVTYLSGRVCVGDSSGLANCQNSDLYWDYNSNILSAIKVRLTGSDPDVSASNGNSAEELYLNWGMGDTLINRQVYLDIIQGSTSNDICSQNSGYGWIGRCSSGKRFKENISNMDMGIETVMNLKPRVFSWKRTNESDVGFIAEEVMEVSPILVRFNSSGEVNGVKYRQINALLAKAIQEQQAELGNIQNLICRDFPDSEICSEKKVGKKQVFNSSQRKYIPPAIDREKKPRNGKYFVKESV